MSRHVYIGFNENGDPQLVISQEKLAPCGPRLKRGNDFPGAVYEFYESFNASTAREGIRALEAFLDGKEYVGEKLEFGQSLKTKRKTP